jgi:hypothetical protein
LFWPSIVGVVIIIAGAVTFGLLESRHSVTSGGATTLPTTPDTTQPSVTTSTTPGAGNGQLPVRQGPLVPIPKSGGQLGYSPSDPNLVPIYWSKAYSGRGYDELPLQHDGVRIAMKNLGYVVFVPVPGALNDQSVRIDTETRLVSGPPATQLGAGCWDGNFLNIWFILADDGTWSLQRSSPKPNGNVVDLLTGIAKGLHTLQKPTKITVFCGASSPQGTTRFMLAINGTTVANLIVGAQSPTWQPILTECSCGRAVGAADFNNTVES